MTYLTLTCTLCDHPVNMEASGGVRDELNRPFHDCCLLIESHAAAIFTKAVTEGQAAELLDCLFSGGSVTIDAITGQLVMVTADLLAQLGEP